MLNKQFTKKVCNCVNKELLHRPFIPCYIDKLKIPASHDTSLVLISYQKCCFEHFTSHIDGILICACVIRSMNTQRFDVIRSAQHQNVLMCNNTMKQQYAVLRFSVRDEHR